MNKQNQSPVTPIKPGINMQPSRHNKQFSRNEKKYLRDNYGIKSHKEIAEELNRTPRSIGQAIIRFGIAKRVEARIAKVITPPAIKAGLLRRFIRWVW